MKHFGVYLDQILTFQDELKNIVASGIKTSYAIRDIFSFPKRLFLLNAFVLYHLHLYAILLTSISGKLNTTLEKQLN